MIRSSDDVTNGSAAVGRILNADTGVFEEASDGEDVRNGSAAVRLILNAETGVFEEASDGEASCASTIIAFPLPVCCAEFVLKICSYPTDVQNTFWKCFHTTAVACILCYRKLIITIT